jgi:hypothetical protein
MLFRACPGIGILACSHSGHDPESAFQANYISSNSFPFVSLMNFATKKMLNAAKKV